MSSDRFSPLEIDAIGEILNISLGASATAVSSMLSKRVDITTPRVKVLTAEEFEFTNLEPAIGVEITYVAGLKGTNVMLLKRSDVKAIVEILMMTEIPDEEFELNEIKENLYTFSTIGIVGKNASGKTTAVELLALVYEILSFFRVKNSYLIDIIDKKLNLDITFYHEGYIYRYITVLLPSSTKTITFANELLYKRLYFKTHAKDLFNYDKYEEVDTTNFHLPDDTSMLYYVLKKLLLRGVYLSSDDFNYMGYSEAFDTYKLFNSTSIISKILKMFDEHLENIAKLKETLIIKTDS